MSGMGQRHRHDVKMILKEMFCPVRTKIDLMRLVGPSWSVWQLRCT